MSTFKFCFLLLSLCALFNNGPAYGLSFWNNGPAPLAYPIGNDNQGGVTTPAGTFAGTPSGLGSLNPYTGNATRIVNDLSVPVVGEIGLSWTRYSNSRTTSGLLAGGSYGNYGSWTHSYQWGFSLYLPGSLSVPKYPTITVQYPNGALVYFIPASAGSFVFVPSPGTNVNSITDYIVVDQAGFTSTKTLGGALVSQTATAYSSFCLVNSKNQVYHFSMPQAAVGTSTKYTLDSITDSRGQVTTLTYDYPSSVPRLIKVTEPGGRYLQINYVNANFQSSYYIGSVVSSDSRTVTYNYTTITIPPHQLSPGATFYQFSSVTYPDHPTQATAFYTYQGDATLGQTTLLSAAKDVRAQGVPSIQYTFFAPKTGYTSPPVGGVQTVAGEISPGNFVTIAQAGVPINSGTTYNSLNPLTQFPDSSSYNVGGYLYSIQNGSGGMLQQMTNTSNQSSTFAYSSNSGSWTDNSGTWTTTATDADSNTTATTKTFLGKLVSRSWPKGTGSVSETWTYSDFSVNYTVTTTFLHLNGINGTADYSNTYSFIRAFPYLKTYTDTLTHQVVFTRDSNNLVTNIAYPDGTSESFTYGTFNQVATHTRRNGAVENFTYFPSGPYFGFIQTVKDANGNATAYTYDAHYRLASVTDPNGNTTSFQYDINGNVTQVTHPDTTAQTSTYDNFGNVLTATNEFGKTQTYVYDGFNRLLTSQDPLLRVTAYTYDPNAPDNQSPIKVTYPSGKKTSATYVLSWGYKTQSVTAGAETGSASTLTTYAYDNNGLLATVTDAQQHKIGLFYDQRNRVSSVLFGSLVTDPVQNEIDFYYDDASNLVSEVTPDGTTTSVYDFMNRPTQATDPKGQVVKMSYDPEGQLKTYSEPNNQIYNYTYDNLERQLTMQYPDKSSEAYAYDPLGNLLTYTTRDGKVETCNYDSRNRVSRTSWNDGVTPAVYYTYDNASRLTNLSNINSAIGYSYDDANQLQSETQTIAGLPAKVVGYTYTPDGQANTLTYPDNTVLTYGYDPRQNLTTILQGSSTVATYGYDSNNNRTGKTLANGVASTLTYDTLQRLTAITDLTPIPAAGTQLQGFSYGFDGMNRRKFVKKSSGLGDVYSYDPSGQLNQVLYDAVNPDGTPSAPQRTVGYSFDPDGNRTLLSDKLASETTAFTLSYTPNADNQYTNVGAATLGYDGRGNLATYQEHGATQTHTVSCAYDARNLLLSAHNNFDTTSLTQAYDPLGRCVKRVENGTTTYFVYDTGWNLLAEYTSAGVEQARYVGGSATDEVLTKTDAGGNVLYYHTDGLGSVTKLTDSTGALVEGYTYDVYGNPTIKNAQGSSLWVSAVGNRFLFTGREYLYSLGVYDFRTRIYDPYLGRFWQPDSIRHGGDAYNLNRYCNNDPVNNTDPFGEDYTDSWIYSGNGFTSWGSYTQTTGKSISYNYTWSSGYSGAAGGFNSWGSGSYLGDGMFLSTGGPWTNTWSSAGQSFFAPVTSVPSPPQTTTTTQTTTSPTVTTGQFFDLEVASDPSAGKFPANYFNSAMIDMSYWSSQNQASLTIARDAINNGSVVLGVGSLGAGIIRSVAARSTITLAEEVGILRAAAQGKGNFGVGAATASDAVRLGRAWVGDGYTVATDGKTLISSNGLRQFRPPSLKPNSPFAATGSQANFEWRNVPKGPWQGNGHLDIR